MFALDEPAHCMTARRGRDGASSDQTFALGFHCTQDPISAEETTPLISAEETTPLISAEETTPLISAEASGCIGVLPIQSAERGGLRKQNGIGVDEDGDPMYTVTSRGDHAVFAFDEVQITHPENRSTVSPGGPVPTVSPGGPVPTVSPGGPVPTVSATSRLSVAGGPVPRRLTPREYERCFGFPDDYTLVDGSSDSTRYEALGNSMAVPVMRWLGERILAVEGILRRTRG